MEIVVGTKVRSFDFALGPDGRALTGERACYIEGVVTGFERLEGCDRYEIKVTRDVFGGKEDSRRVGATIYPPVNGTPTWSGRVMDGVEVIA